MKWFGPHSCSLMHLIVTTALPFLNKWFHRKDSSLLHRAPCTIMGFSDLRSFCLHYKLLTDCFAAQFLPAALCVEHCQKQNNILPENLSSIHDQRTACLFLIVLFVCWNIVSEGIIDMLNHNFAAYDSLISPSCPKPN